MLTCANSRLALVLYTLQHQELGFHLRGAAHHPLGADADDAARTNRDPHLERLGLSCFVDQQPVAFANFIITDFGESHYISGPEPNHSDDGSSAWAAGFPHDAWRDLMKPYIAAYKSGSTTPIVDQERVVYWYRPTPKDTKCTNDQIGLPRGVELLADVVFASTMLTQPATLTVTSGNQAPQSITVPAGINTFNFTIGVGNQQFAVSRNGKTLFGGTAGLPIKDSCVTYNYNAYVGKFPTDGGTTPPPPQSSTATTSSKTSTSSTTLKTTTSSSSSSKPVTSSTTTTTSQAPTTSPGGDRK